MGEAISVILCNTELYAGEVVGNPLLFNTNL